MGLDGYTKTQSRDKEVTNGNVTARAGEEKKTNVFLRADEPSVAAKLHMKGASAVEVFGELRERKNKS